MATEPLNIIVGPFEVWTAPVGTAFPDLDEVPAVAWQKLGSNQSLEYNEDGVSVEHEQTVDMHRFLGSTGPRKATRSEEGLRIELTVHDLSMETYAKALGNTVATTAPGAGQIGTRAVAMYRGLDVDQFALLVRGASPYVINQSMQYEVPVTVVDGEPEVVYAKDEPAGLLFSFYALEDIDAATPADRFGRLYAFFAAATP
jgi:hypothetical protein